MATVQELEHQLQIADAELRQLKSDNELLRTEIEALKTKAASIDTPLKPFVPVIVESPYAGDTDRNLRYLRAAMRECLLNGEAPYASHALYTQPGVLDDNDPVERRLGIIAGLAWGRFAFKTVVYQDLGISRGMQTGIDDAKQHGRNVERRLLSDWKG